jgi:hypothetical protein
MLQAIRMIQPDGTSLTNEYHLQDRTVQPLMSTVFDAPVLAVVSQESFGPHGAGLADGRQPIDFGVGFGVYFFGVGVA